MAATRDNPRPPVLAKQRRRGLVAGRLGLVSVNTWIIVVNVAVFLLGNFVFPLLFNAAVQRGSTGAAEMFISKQGAGRIYFNTPGADQIARGELKKDITRQMPNSPNFFYHPIIDPKAVVADPQGRVLLSNGQAVHPDIGGDRFTIRPVLDAWGHFSTGKAFLELQVWRFITFQFLHMDITHLMFNMLGLWFVGGMVEEFLGRRRYLAFYLTCGIFGAIGYLALNFIGWLVAPHIAPAVMEKIPALLFDDIYMPLVGASAGVFGVLLAAAYIAPDSIVDVALLIPMRMKTAVYAFLALAMLNLLRGGNNAGGDAAHVGGAFAGYYFIRHMHLLRDFFDFVGMPRPKGASRSAADIRHDRELDRIVRKVRAEGVESLNAAERRTLHNDGPPDQSPASAAQGPAS